MIGQPGRRRRTVTSHPEANVCHRCGEDIKHTRDMARTTRGQWVHKRCMGGGDE